MQLRVKSVGWLYYSCVFHVKYLTSWHCSLKCVVVHVWVNPWSKWSDMSSPVLWSREFHVELLGEVSVSNFVNGVIIPLEYISRKYFEVKLTAPDWQQWAVPRKSRATCLLYLTISWHTVPGLFQNQIVKQSWRQSQVIPSWSRWVCVVLSFVLLTGPHPSCEAFTTTFSTDTFPNPRQSSIPPHIEINFSLFLIYLHLLSLFFLLCFLCLVSSSPFFFFFFQYLIIGFYGWALH